MNGSGKEKIFWIVYACFLILLFLMSSTDLIIKERTPEIYRVSVIVDDSKDDYYFNFRKGMEQAAIDYNVDVSFITLYERNSGLQQEKMMTREISDGAQAVVLAPVNPIECTTMLEKIGSNVPVIILNNEVSASQVQTNLTADYFEAGRQMAEAIAEENDETSSVYLFTEGLKLASNARFYDGVASVLQKYDYETTLVDKSSAYGYGGILDNLISSKDKNTVLVALDSESLVMISEALEARMEESGEIPLYGYGATMQILNYVDKGIITGIITVNQYDAGYLSMENAVAAIQNKSEKSSVELNHFYLEKTDITKKEYEKMLYPID